MNLINHTGLRLGPQRKRERKNWRIRVMRRLFEEGLDRASVAEVLGVSPGTVRRWGGPRSSRRAGAIASARLRTESYLRRRATAASLLDWGMPFPDVAAELGISEDTLEDYFKR